MEENARLMISASPHIRAKADTRWIMGMVLLALCPAVLAGAYFFGIRALLVVGVSVGSCVFFEWGYRRLTHKPQSISDLSAAVTGMLLGLSLGVKVPLWLPVLGGFFAIVVVKQLYGGIGKNFLNPALAGRCFLFSWAVLMTDWAAPRSGGFFSLHFDAVSAATPLASMKAAELPEMSLLDCFLGMKAGSIGEVSALALLLGAAFLLLVGVINLRIPGAYLLTVAVLTFLFPRGNERLPWMAYQLLSGGLMLGALFMANDYTTSPVTPLGDALYGFGCGVLTVIIRYFGSYPEGVSFAILIMNLLVWAIDKWTLPRRFGVAKEAKK